MGGTTSLSVIVPVYNEQFLVESSLSRLTILSESSLLNRVQIVVVDDGSTDATSECLSRFRESAAASCTNGKMEWIFLRQESNQGKGAAVRTALQHASGELAVIHDADLEYHPRDLLKMIPLFLEEDADAVFGSRFLAGDYKRALFFRHALGNDLLTFLCDLVSDLNLTDMETCYKMVRTELLKSIPIVSSDFRIEPELTIKLAKRGAQFFEVPISYSGRTYQEGKKINWKDGVLALSAILRFAISDRIYAPDPLGNQILNRMNRAPRYNRWMTEVVRPYVGDTVLEIGAGIGNLALLLLPRASYLASDTNPLHLNTLRRLSKTRPYFRVQFVDPSSAESFPPANSFETVLCLNKLEHLEDDVAGLRNIRNALRDGGRAIILVPNMPRLYGSLDEALGHRRRYTREQLIRAGEQAGLQMEAVLPFNRCGAAAWWLNNQVLRRNYLGLVQIKALNFLTPILRRLDRWVPFPPLSWIAVFRKGSANG